MDTIQVKTREGDVIQKPARRQARRTTVSGEAIEIPDNRYELYDSQLLAAVMQFFLPNPTGGDTVSNYDTQPPNPSEDTIITGLRISFDDAILQSDGTNSISAINILNAVSGGTFVVQERNNKGRLLDVPVGQLMNFTADEFGTGGVVLSQSGVIYHLPEVIHVPRGVAYRGILTLAEGATLPTDANWTASEVAKPRIRVTAEHAGASGR